MTMYSSHVVAKSGKVQKAGLIAVARSVSAAAQDESLYTKVLNFLESLWQDPKVCHNRYGFGKQTYCSRKQLKELVDSRFMHVETNLGIGFTSQIILAIEALKR